MSNITEEKRTRFLLSSDADPERRSSRIVGRLCHTPRPFTERSRAIRAKPKGTR